MCIYIYIYTCFPRDTVTAKTVGISISQSLRIRAFGPEALARLRGRCQNFPHAMGFINVWKSGTDESRLV